MKPFLKWSLCWVVLMWTVAFFLGDANWYQAAAFSGVTYIIPFGGIWCSAIMAWA